MREILDLNGNTRETIPDGFLGTRRSARSRSLRLSQQRTHALEQLQQRRRDDGDGEVVAVAVKDALRVRMAMEE